MSDIDAIRARHQPSVMEWASGGSSQVCADDDILWPCDTAILLAALAEREAEVERLRTALEAIVAVGPAHDAAYWGLADHPTIEGADCQNMSWARDTARAALADTPEPTP